MATKKKAARAGTRTASNTAFDSRNHTVPDPLMGFELANPSRNRQPKRSRKRGKQRGRIDAFLLAELTMLANIALLLVGGLSHA